MNNKADSITISKDASTWLEVMLSLVRKPVGVRFLYDQNDYENCDTPEPKVAQQYCVAVKNATLGRSCKLGLNKISCLSGARVLGMLPASQDIIDQTEVKSGRRHFRMGLYADYGISRQVAKDMIYCQHHVLGVEIKPLEQFEKATPDVVIIIANSLNIMRLIQGYAYHFGQLKNIKMVGNQAICQECTSYPFEMNQPNISMLCAGTRKVAKWQDDEIAMGIPFNQLDKIIDGVKATSNLMDDNQTKKKIIERAENMNIGDKLDVKLSCNYYKGSFGTLSYHRNKH